MKIVKLDRRWRQYKENHHQVAFRFDHWCKQASEFESALTKLTKSSGWERNSPWYSYYGKVPNKTGTRPYYITVRDENLVTMVLLTAGNTHE